MPARNPTRFELVAGELFHQPPATWRTADYKAASLGFDLDFDFDFSFAEPRLSQISIVGHYALKKAPTFCT